MRFVIDLDTLELIASATARQAIAQVQGKRGDETPFEVSFVRAGVAEELAGSTVLTFGAKPFGKYDAGAVVLNSDFTLSGTGTTAKYLASPSFNTAELNDLYLIDADDSNDPAYVDLMAEFTWQIGSGAPTSTKTFIFRVHNDVVRDAELDPTALPTPVGTTAPVNAVAATGIMNPTGADNSILYTADNAGAAGNNISLQYLTPATQATTTVAVVGSAIAVTPGTKARMLISGTFSPSIAPVLIYAGTANGKAMWSEDGTQGGALTGNDQLYYDGTKWLLFMTTVGPDYSAQTAATSADYPDGLAFTVVTGTGTPTVTAATSSAAQVIAAVNLSTPAAALVTASASGTVTEAVAAVAATNLTGGVTATASPPYIRTAGGFLYIQEAGTWKKTALSAL